MLLEGPLHPDVPFGRDIERGHEDPPDVLRDLSDVLHGTLGGYLLHQVLVVELALSGDLREYRVDLREDVLVHDVADIRDSEYRLDPARYTRK